MSRPGNKPARRPVGPWLAALVGGLCFVNSFTNDFVYDDRAIVLHNPRITNLFNPKIWLTDWWQPQDLAEEDIPNLRRDRLYRPLAMFTFALNHALHGLDPRGYHILNIALHMVACALVWRFAQRLLNDAAISTCAALLFAVHPIHSEAVANIVGRAEVLAAIFLLGGLLLLMPASGAPPGVGRALLAAPLFFAALLSKETAVCYVPVALLAMHAVRRNQARPAKTWWLTHTAILLVPMAAYLPLRYAALERHLLRDLDPAPTFNPVVIAEGSARWTAPFTIVGHYTRLLLAPAQLSSDYGLRIVDPDAGPNAMTALGFAAAVGLGVALWGYRRPAGLWRQLAVLTALSAASYALISNTALLIGVSLAERLMYWPSVPLLLLLAAGVVGWWRNACARGKPLHDSAKLLRAFGVALLAALGLRSVVRNMDWADNLTLFLTDVATYPQGVQLNSFVARQLIWEASQTRDEQQGRALLARADDHLQHALQLYSRNADTLGLRGELYGLRGDRANAIAYLESALQLETTEERFKKLLAKLRGTAPDPEKIAALENQVKQQPNDAALRFELGKLLLDAGQHKQALRELEQAVKLAPENVEAWYSLGEALAANAKTEEAVRAFQQVVTRDPTRWQAHANLTALLGESNPPEALRHAQEALRLKPDEYRNHQNLAEALAVNERFAEAIEKYRQILRGLPETDPMHIVVVQRLQELERRRR